MKSSVLVAAMSATMFFVTPLVHAELIRFHAKLNGLNEVPSNASPGIGLAEIEFDTTAHTMHVTADFSDLLGTVTVAHIHCCTPLPLTSTAGVATTTPTFPGFPAGITSGSYDQLFDLTQASSFSAAFITANGGTPAGAEAALIAGSKIGRSYFNIHSNQFPGGEIRGFLVPEPTTLGLLALGLVAGLVSRCRQRILTSPIQ